MDKITQEAYFRQRVMKYAEAHGVTASANRHHLSRKTVHKWKKRYDGTLKNREVRRRLMVYNLRASILVHNLAVPEPALELLGLRLVAAGKLAFAIDRFGGIGYTTDESILVYSKRDA